MYSINEEHLKCGNCKKILTLPIKLHAKIGNICGVCLNTEHIEGNLILNSPFIELISDLLIPCINTKYGCKEKIKITIKGEHEKRCKFGREQRIDCGFFCQESFLPEQLKDHYKIFHPRHLIVNEERPYFTVGFDISISLWNTVNDTVTNDTIPNDTMIFSSINGSFMFRYKAICSLNQLVFELFSMNEKILTDDCFDLTVVINNESKQFVLPVTPLFQHVDDLKVTWNKSFEDAHVICILNKKEKTRTKNYLTENFDCPICEEVMKPPIYMCLLGHSICQNCKPKLEQCPTCSNPFGETRNFLVEELFNKIEFPCSFHPCPYSNYGELIIKHEATCEYRKFVCTFCEFNTYNSGDYVKDLKNHIDRWHTLYKCEIGNNIDFTKYLSNKLDESLVRLILFYDDEIFRFTCWYEANNLVFGLEVLGESVKKTEYIYEVDLFAVSRSKRNVYRLSRSYIVCSETEKINLLQRAIKIPYSLIKSMFPTKVVSYSLKIYKKTDYII